jgi:hypothetical protein
MSQIHGTKAYGAPISLSQSFPRNCSQGIQCIPSIICGLMSKLNYSRDYYNQLIQDYLFSKKKNSFGKSTITFLLVGREVTGKEYRSEVSFRFEVLPRVPKVPPTNTTYNPMSQMSMQQLEKN